MRTLCDEGLIAGVSGSFPAEKLLGIGDALLASPVLVLAVTLDSGGALDGIALLRERFGTNMLIGAGNVRTVEQFDQAVTAGAQFTIAPNFDVATVERALLVDVLHLPGVATRSEAQMARRNGCPMVNLSVPDTEGTGYVEMLRGHLEEPRLAVVEGVTAETAGDFARAGAAAVGLGKAVVTGPDQAMDDLIRRARSLRSAWRKAREE